MANDSDIGQHLNTAGHYLQQAVRANPDSAVATHNLGKIAGAAALCAS